MVLVKRDQNFSGVIAPVLTPFGADGAPDAARFVAHADWLLANGCTALAPFGTTSEANSIGLDERMELLEDLIDAGVGSEVLMVGTGLCSARDASILTQHAVDTGCGGVLMLPPFYYKSPSDDGLFDYYARVIEDVADDKLRVYLYHYPQMSSVALSLDLVGRLVDAYPDTVVGLKDSSGDEQYLMAVLKAFPGLEVFPGTERLMLKGLQAGAAGVISATANIACEQLRGLFDNWQTAGADDQQKLIIAMRTALEDFPAIPVLKAIIAHYRRDDGWGVVCPPLRALSSELAAEAVAVLAKRHGFFLEFK